LFGTPTVSLLNVHLVKMGAHLVRAFTNILWINDIRLSQTVVISWKIA